MSNDTNHTGTKPENTTRTMIKALVQLVLVIAFLAALLMTSQLIGKAPEPLQQSEVKSEGIIVDTIVVSPVSEKLKITTTGTVRVRNNINIVPQVSGRVETVYENFKDGGMFEKEVVLFEIEPDDYRNELSRLQAQVETAQTRLALQEAEAISAIEEWQTLNPNRPVPDLVARKPQMDQAQAELKSARSQLANAHLNLKRTEYKLPFAGRVVNSAIEVGQYLQAGQSYGTLYAQDSLEVAVPVQDALLQWFVPGESQAVISTHYRGQEVAMKGNVTRVSGELDSETRFASLIITPVDNEWIKLVPGVFVDVTLIGPVIDGLWRVPNDVLQEGQKIWSVDQNYQLRSLQPRIINVGEADTLILSDGSSATLVRGMIDGPANGMKVRVNNKEKTE